MAVNINNYQKIKTQLQSRNVTLVAVSKIKTKEEIMELYDLGQRDFGENYVQELLEKYASLPKDIRWHFIGHLQTNKVKYIADFIHLIHGVDSENLLKEINKQGKKINRKIKCLLQMHISREETKYGFEEDNVMAVLKQTSQDSSEQVYSYIEVCGLMGMATFTEDNALIISEFKKLKYLFDQLQPVFPSSFNILSMGMSADYMFAVEEGSTMVRIGSLLFGARNYKP